MWADKEKEMVDKLLFVFLCCPVLSGETQRITEAFVGNDSVFRWRKRSTDDAPDGLREGVKPMFCDHTAAFFITMHLLSEMIETG